MQRAENAVKLSNNIRLFCLFFIIAVDKQGCNMAFLKMHSRTKKWKSISFFFVFFISIITSMWSQIVTHIKILLKDNVYVYCLHSAIILNFKLMMVKKKKKSPLIFSFIFFLSYIRSFTLCCCWSFVFFFTEKEEGKKKPTLNLFIMLTSVFSLFFFLYDFFMLLFQSIFFLHRYFSLVMFFILFIGKLLHFYVQKRKKNINVNWKEENRKRMKAKKIKIKKHWICNRNRCFLLYSINIFTFVYTVLWIMMIC